MLWLLNIFYKHIIEAIYSQAHFALIFKKQFHFLMWKLSKWNINNSAPNHNLLTAANESAPPTHTTVLTTSPLNLCLLADSSPLFVPCPLSWGVRSLCCYFCTAHSVAGQDRGWTQDRGTREGDKGLEWWGGHLLWQVWGAGSIRSLCFFRECKHFTHISCPSFHSLIPSSVTFQTGHNFWWPVSASFHQRYYNQLSRDLKEKKHISLSVY